MRDQELSKLIVVHDALGGGGVEGIKEFRGNRNEGENLNILVM